MGRRREQGGFRAAAAATGERGEEEKEGGRGEADKWAPTVSGSRKKRKGEGEGGPTREAGWAAWAEKEPVWFSLFFSFPFSNFIFKSFFISNSNQTFSNFSQEFYRLFRNHTSNQKPCKPTDDAHTLVVSKFIKLSLIFLELNLNSNLISLNP
jgi:hypothetical protein